MDGEADRYNEMTDEEFEKEAARQGTTPFKLAKRGVHDGMKNFRHYMRQMEIAREIMKRRLKEQAELVQDPEFKADLQFLEKEIPEHKKDLKVMKEEMRKL